MDDGSGDPARRAGGQRQSRHGGAALTSNDAQGGSSGGRTCSHETELRVGIPGIYEGLDSSGSSHYGGVWQHAQDG